MPRSPACMFPAKPFSATSCTPASRTARSKPASSGPAGTAEPNGHLTSTVTDAIRSGILDRRYPLGSRLDQQTLADEFGASIIPIRESLRQLEAEGLVQIAPRRGAFVVSPPTEDEVREVYRLREVLEAYATTEAVCALTAADIDEMDALLVQMAQVGRSTTDEQWSRLNRTWHFRLYSGAQSPLLLQFINTLWDRCRLTSNVQARDLGHRDRSNEDHTRIMAAVRARRQARRRDHRQSCA